jgi:hypothetical protein
MQYTIQPLPIVDSLHDHSGFTFVCFIVTFIFLVAWAAYECADSRHTWKVYAGVGVALLTWARHESWTTGSIVYPKNVQVTGTLAGFIAEGYATSERVGKQTQVQQHHYTYVIYSVEGGRVMYRSNEGQSWPYKAVLYKN